MWASTFDSPAPCVSSATTTPCSVCIFPNTPHQSSRATVPTRFSTTASGSRRVVRRPAHRFDLPLAISGTPFQQAVWTALGDIEHGNTVTYGALAARLGRPTASRAIGAAVGRNPLSIVIPCHRVVGRDGRLTGYAGGVWRKRWLLAHETSSGALFARSSTVRHEAAAQRTPGVPGRGRRAARSTGTASALRQRVHCVSPTPHRYPSACCTCDTSNPTRPCRPVCRGTATTSTRRHCWRE